MKKILYCLLVILTFQQTTFAQSSSCEKWNTWSRSVCERLQAILYEGNTDLYLSGYAWHNRYTYSSDKIKTYNEHAWGGGIGKGRYNEYGNWEGLYMLAFLDSHNRIQPLGGYSWQKIFRPTEQVKLGLGFTAFLTSRSDIYDNIPFPGLLPVATLGYKQVTLNAIYIPGAKGAGNVLFLIGRYTFDQ